MRDYRERMKSLKQENKTYSMNELKLSWLFKEEKKNWRLKLRISKE